MNITLPIRTVSEANVREHWAVKAKRARSQRSLTTLTLNRLRKPQTPISLTITRVRPKGTRPLDRLDNLPRSLKAVIDAFCVWAGVDDGDEANFDCKFKQEIGNAYSVILEW